MKTLLITASFIYTILFGFSNQNNISTTIENKNVEVEKQIQSVNQKEFSTTQLLGTYEIENQGYFIKITLKDKVLYAEQSWNKASYIIKKSKGNTFIGKDEKRFTFSNLNNGLVQQLTVEGERKALFIRK